MKSSLENPADLESRISAAFPAETDITRSIASICSAPRGPEDTEDIEETGHFLNKSWKDVTASDWRQHHSALYFFSDDAFRYFIPSVMTQSLEDYDNTHLAVSALISSLLQTGDQALQRWNRERWLGLNNQQLTVAIDWLGFIKSHTRKYESENDIDKAVSFLTSLMHSRG